MAKKPPPPPRTFRQSIPWYGSWILAAVVFVLYLALLPAAPGDKDSGEFTLALANPMLLGELSVRRRFEAKHGFNPLEGVEIRWGANEMPEPESLAQQVGRVINGKSARPVILFQPQTGSVRMLRKP